MCDSASHETVQSRTGVDVRYIRKLVHPAVMDEV